jgi:hypothetical protein
MSVGDGTGLHVSTFDLCSFTYAMPARPGRHVRAEVVPT